MEAWKRLTTALGAHAAKLQLRPGASAKAIKVAERKIGQRLPEDYRAWLAIADGQEVGGLSIMPNGNWLISLARMLETWEWERRFDLDDYDSIAGAQDRERIRSFVFHPGRLVVAGSRFLDYDNNLLDLVPGPAGTAGQLIVFVTECDYVVLAPSLTAYFDRVADLLGTGKLAPHTFEDGDALAAPERGVWNWLARGEKPYRSRTTKPKPKAKPKAKPKPKKR